MNNEIGSFLFTGIVICFWIAVAFFVVILIPGAPQYIGEQYAGFENGYRQVIQEPEFCFQ